MNLLESVRQNEEKLFENLDVSEIDPHLRNRSEEFG